MGDVKSRPDARRREVGRPATLKFGSSPGLNLVVASDTQITVVAPPGTGKVDVTVTGVGGTSAKSSKDKFSHARL